MKKQDSVLIFVKIIVLTVFPFASMHETFGQTDSSNIKLISEEEIITTFEKTQIIFQILDENENAIKYLLTMEQRRKIEDKIKEYERSNNITDRNGKVYFLNTKYAVVSIGKNEK